MQTLVLASGNAGKLREFNDLLGTLGFDVKAQSAYNVPEAIEDGLSFVENAIIKARNACEVSGLPALADDSGIEVDALNGAPGIYSARYAGPDANDSNNNAALLKALENTPKGKRSARYQCVLVFMRHAQDPTPLICQGSWEGEILVEPEGNGGFGYDPIFWVPSHNMAAAQLDKNEKNKISHRGKALKLLIEALQNPAA
ncbi:RdgB/HAM1 family non-canonical purine NTP pyrophosphatase [Marinagarivorans cellulosilyticus]|uniref:dITP/XTP pyrophosphatase n=1 Tax=Marinagarivorans cellulosilyticus TaxID=2721545 RepID=A0AAN1WI02_9GAMM|nr:RdgB/HAM1 family non-canonical purine NTP pyrophosphatase [Marinagarivorans cellulosilyticus]BCD97946.1 XTP/dITP diphosphohydrolase [Marinagarivorans cellulosilyticus]